MSLTQVRNLAEGTWEEVTRWFSAKPGIFTLPHPEQQLLFEYADRLRRAIRHGSVTTRGTGCTSTRPRSLSSAPRCRSTSDARPSTSTPASCSASPIQRRAMRQHPTWPWSFRCSGPRLRPSSSTTTLALCAQDNRRPPSSCRAGCSSSTCNTWSSSRTACDGLPLRGVQQRSAAPLGGRPARSCFVGFVAPAKRDLVVGHAPLPRANVA